MKDIRGEVREFLTTRRAKITPERAGLPSYGGRRRVAGLRRDEVALLAGISIEYYTRLERGNIRGASAEVLDGIAGRCSSTRWSGRTWPTWSGRRTRPARAARSADDLTGCWSGRACSGCWTR